MYLQFGINQVEAGNEEKRKTGWKPPKVELVVTPNGVHFTDAYVDVTAVQHRVPRIKHPLPPVL